MLFPGYGSLSVGMGKELYDHSRIMQEYFEEAENCLDKNVIKLAFASSDLELSMMSNAYPIQFVLSASIAAMLKQEGITPSLVAGYNLGAYAALFAAGGISFPDGLYLLNKYASLYQESLEQLPSVEIIQVKGIAAKPVQKLCAQFNKGDEVAAIAIYHSDDEHIVAGTSSTIDHLRDLLEREDVQVHEVPREVGLHSALLDPVVAQFKMYLEKVDCKDLQIPLLNSADDQIIDRGADAKQMLIDLINKPLNWHYAVKALAAYDLIIQVGPGSDLVALVSDEYPEKKVIAVNKLTDLEQLKKIMNESQVIREN